MILSYKIHNVAPYINWIYFFHAWGFQPRFAAIANIHGCDVCRASWLTTFPEEDRNKASEAMQLFKEANRMLDLLDRDYEVRTIFKLCKANSDGDNLVIEKETGQFLVFPLLRQQTPKRDGSPFLCLSDFIRPLSSGIPDTIGAFASCIDADMEGLYEQDPYKHLLVQTLSDRLAEAATEKMHEYVRKEAWGYAKDESLSMPDLLVEKYPCRRLPVPARSIHQFPVGRTAGYETDRHHTDREWCHVPSCFGLRSDVCPSGCRILLCRKDRRRPARRLCPPSGKKYGGNAKIPGCQSAITFVYL